MSSPNRLYGELAWIWPLLSPPLDYVEEAQVYIDWFRELGVPEGGSILHLGCGGGSIDYHLKNHFEVTGVDKSPGMLLHARKVNPEVRYVEGDMLGAYLGSVFDGVLIHDAIAYLTTFEQLRTVFRVAAAHLNPGGAILCFPEQVEEAFVQDQVKDQIHTDGEVTVHTIEVSHDAAPEDNVFQTTYLFMVRRGDNLQVHVDTHTIGIFPLMRFLFAAKSEKLDVDTHKFTLASEPNVRYDVIAGKRAAD